PRVTHHMPAADIAGTVTNVDIWFSEQIDTNSPSPGDISILNPTNGAIAATSLQNVGFNQYRIGFAPQILIGQYHVFVSTNVTDLAGNTLQPSTNLPSISYDASFNLVPVDLQLSNLVPITNQLAAGDLASVSWQGRNTTGAPLVGSWIDAVYL